MSNTIQVKILYIFFSLLSIYTFGQNQNISNESNFNGEPYIAINPINSNNIVVAWMHVSITSRPIRTRTSFDGGLTWNNPVDLPIVHTNTADPSMAFDNSGNLFISYIDHLGTSSSTNDGAIYTYKSTDGGISWGNQSIAIDINADGNHQPIDRPWLVCDKSGGVNDGNLYITTKSVSGGPPPFRPYFVRSVDGGNNWDNWIYVDTIGWLSSIPSTFAAPTITADGKFTAMYPSYVTSQYPLPRYLMATFDNANNTFNYKSSIVDIPSASNDSAKRGWQFIADPGDANHLAFLFTSGSNGDLDIFMTETYDYGTSWTPKIRINKDPIGNGVLQDLVWGSFDEDSDLVVTWRDRRNSGGTGYNQSSEIFGSVRWNDSTAFSQDFTISDTLVPYNNILSQAGNDFMCQKILNDTLYVTWGDTRTNFLNIWFQKIDLVNGQAIGIASLASDEFPITKIYPNPTNDVVTIDIKSQTITSIQVYNSNGKKVKTEYQKSFSIKNLSSGVYYLVIETIEKKFTKKLIVN